MTKSISNKIFCTLLCSASFLCRSSAWAGDAPPGMAPEGDSDDDSDGDFDDEGDTSDEESLLGLFVDQGVTY